MSATITRVLLTVAAIWGTAGAITAALALLDRVKGRH